MPLLHIVKGRFAILLVPIKFVLNSQVQYMSTGYKLLAAIEYGLCITGCNRVRVMYYCKHTPTVSLCA